MSETFGYYSGFEGGMNNGLPPDNLPENQFYKGINIICRGGEIQPRPSFDLLPLTFSTPEDKVSFENGKFQGGFAYTPGNQRYIVCIISGVIYILDVTKNLVTNLSADNNIVLNQNIPRVWFTQAEQFGILQDGSNAAVILDGATARLADASKDEVPTGTIMQYGHGRLFVKTTARSFLAGDIIKAYDPKSVLVFKETNYLNGGGAFTVPNEVGEITSMTFSDSYDTSTGDGPLIVFGSRGAMSYAVYKFRDKWFDTDLSKYQLKDIGVTGPDAITNINQDLFFWDATGLKSYSILKTTATSVYRDINISREIQEFLKDNTSWMMDKASMIAHDSRLLLTVQAEKTTARNNSNSADVDDFCFKGIIVLDFAQVKGGGAISGVYSKTVAFDGLWTGPRPTQLVQLKETAFMFGKTKDDKNTFLSIGKESTGYENGSPILSSFESRAIATKLPPKFFDTPYALKRVQSLRIWFTEVKGKVIANLYLKSDNNTVYSKISSITLEAPVTKADVSGVQTYEVGMPKRLSALPFPFVAVCNSPESNALAGYTFQFRLDWKGYIKFSKTLLKALMVTSNQPISGALSKAENLVRALTLPDMQYNEEFYNVQGGEYV